MVLLPDDEGDTMKMTIKRAIFLAKNGKSKDLELAANALTGCPDGGWPETVQARLQILGFLPARCARDFTLDEFVAGAYVLENGRYQPMPR